MNQNQQTTRLQFRLSYLVAAPLLASPLFIGFSLSNRGNVGQPEAVIHLLVSLLLYVSLCCWLAIRHLSPKNEFRRYPFRGSLLLGGLSGALFAMLALTGMCVGIAVHFPVVRQIAFADLVSLLMNATFQSLIYGGVIGMFFGLLSGGLYCAVRYVGLSHSRVTPISKKAWRRRRRDGQPLDLRG